MPDFKSPAKTGLSAAVTTSLPLVSIPDFKSPAKTEFAPEADGDFCKGFHTRLQVACQNMNIVCNDDIDCTVVSIPDFKSPAKTAAWQVLEVRSELGRICGVGNF